MYQLDHILVSLDLSDMDDFIIRYSSFLAEKFAPKSITFMHVMKTYDIPRSIRESYLEWGEPLTDIVKEDLQEKVDANFNMLEGVQIHVLVKEGVTTETIVQYSKENDIQLTLMGKKLGYKGRGSVVRKVLNITPSSVLMISETTQHKIDHVMVRMDFSKTSEMALKMALRLKELTGSRVSCHHVSKLPVMYFAKATRENEAKLRMQMEKHSKKEYAKFMKRLKLDPEQIPCSYSLDTENDEAQILYSQALQAGADMIVIGSKIKSQLADIILDSTSEKLAGAEKNIPVFFVKDRKETLGFLDLLFD